eukprot:tig00021366_g20848.t1
MRPASCSEAGEPAPTALALLPDGVVEAILRHLGAYEAFAVARVWAVDRRLRGILAGMRQWGALEVVGERAGPPLAGRLRGLARRASRGGLFGVRRLVIEADCAAASPAARAGVAAAALQLIGALAPAEELRLGLGGTEPWPGPREQMAAGARAPLEAGQLSELLVEALEPAGGTLHTLLLDVPLFLPPAFPDKSAVFARPFPALRSLAFAADAACVPRSAVGYAAHVPGLRRLAPIGVPLDAACFEALASGPAGPALEALGDPGRPALCPAASLAGIEGLSALRELHLELGPASTSVEAGPAALAPLGALPRLALLSLSLPSEALPLLSGVALGPALADLRVALRPSAAAGVDGPAVARAVDAASRVLTEVVPPLFPTPQPNPFLLSPQWTYVGRPSRAPLSEDEASALARCPRLARLCLRHAWAQGAPAEAEANAGPYARLRGCRAGAALGLDVEVRLARAPAGGEAWAAAAAAALAAALPAARVVFDPEESQ